jgi:hypothetical protein
MLCDREVIDQIVIRREALASIEAAEAADLLDYVDRARAAGEEASEAQGRRRVDAAVHEVSLAMRLPVPTVERQIARARRLRSRLPSVWQAWHDGRVSTTQVGEIDRAARRLTRPDSLAALDDACSMQWPPARPARRPGGWTGGSNAPRPTRHANVTRSRDVTGR